MRRLCRRARYRPCPGGRNEPDPDCNFGGVAADDGIGFMIWNAWQVLTVDTMYVGLLVIAILGFVFSAVLDEIERWLIPWKSHA